MPADPVGIGQASWTAAGSGGAGWIAAMEPDDFREKLAQALEMKEERARRGEAGREFVDRFLKWPTVAADLITLYRSLIEA